MTSFYCEIKVVIIIIVIIIIIIIIIVIIIIIIIISNKITGDQFPCLILMFIDSLKSSNKRFYKLFAIGKITKLESLCAKTVYKAMYFYIWYDMLEIDD